MATKSRTRFTVKQIEALGRPGVYSDGDGLFLVVTPTGSRNWSFRYQFNRKRREMGLGAYPAVTLAAARARAEDLRRMIRRDGVDPLAARKEGEERAAREAAERLARTRTFTDIATEYIAAHRAGWRNPKHASQWTATLQTYAAPILGSMPVADVDRDAVLQVLRPIWTVKTETATRVRSRIELVLNYAEALGLRPAGLKNPATWRGGLDALLPAARKVMKVTHHPALPYKRMGAFMTALSARSGIGARALEFLILTATRSGEVRGARWSEIDLEDRVWVIPAERMKAKREHRVPLSDAATTLLEAVPRLADGPLQGDPYVFPGARAGRPLSDMSLTAHLRGMREEGLDFVDRNGNVVTAHGFRSSFRDWAAETTDYPSEMAEMALAHTVGSKVEAAYRRGDMFTKRRAMMADWATWCAAAQVKGETESEADGEGETVRASRAGGARQAA